MTKVQLVICVRLSVNYGWLVRITGIKWLTISYSTWTLKCSGSSTVDRSCKVSYVCATLKHKDVCASQEELNFGICPIQSPVVICKYYLNWVHCLVINLTNQILQLTFQWTSCGERSTWNMVWISNNISSLVKDEIIRPCPNSSLNKRLLKFNHGWVMTLHSCTWIKLHILAPIWMMF